MADCLSSENEVDMATDQIPAYEILLEPAVQIRRTGGFLMPMTSSCHECAHQRTDGPQQAVPTEEGLPSVRMRLCVLSSTRKRHIVRFAALGLRHGRGEAESAG